MGESKRRRMSNIDVIERTQELQKLNNYIKLLIDSTTDIYMLLDNDIKIIYCSKTIISLLGLKSPEEIIGKPVSDIHKYYLDQEYVKRSQNRLARIKSGEEHIIVEDDVINWTTVGVRSYRITLKRELDANCNFDGIVLTLNDITDVRMEEAQRRLNDMLYSTLLPCLIWNEKGDVIAYNKELSRAFGYSEFFPSDQYWEIQKAVIQPSVQPDGRETESIRQAFMREALEKGFSYTSIQLVNKDGTPKYFNVSAARIAWPSDYRLVVYYHDITELMIREAEAKETEGRIRLMLDSTPLIYILRDKDFNIIDCNLEGLKLFGISDKSEFIRNFRKYSPEFQPDGTSTADFERMLQKKLSESNSYTVERTFLTARGEPIPVETTIVQVDWKGSCSYISYSRDLREIKAKEKKVQESIEQSRKLEFQKEMAQAASEAKTQFLANVSHEIRTPMNAVLGMLELLLSEDLNKRQLRYVGDIKTSAMALLDIINDILDISKIQAGKFNLVPVNFDFRALVENISSMVKFLISNNKKDIRFDLEIQGKLPDYLFGDDIRLRQALLNLLSNAIKFTDRGFVKLHIDVTDSSIGFAVSDSGIGIRANDIPGLFDTFYQVRTQGGRSIRGTGLGLSITKVLIEMMGGNITVESVYGEGTTFHVEIPKILGDRSSINYGSENEIITCSADTKVLAVDDNLINLNVMCGLLRLYNINAETVTSGPEAIELMKINSYDIVFMDYMMPEMNGVEATRIIRGMGKTVPIIALTANAVTGAREMLLEAGMNDYISKPIIKTSLNHIIKNWIPAEKILSITTSSKIINQSEAEMYKDFWERIDEIDELSMYIGLERVSGQRDVYEKSLKLLIKEIEKCRINLNKFLDVNDMHNFCVEVHSMKGSLANTGAMDLSESAYELEVASENENVAFCLLNLPFFLENLNSLSAKLEEAFSGITQNPIPAEIPPELPPIFKNMIHAFENTDYIAIENEMKKLERMEFSGGLKDKIEELKDAVLVMDYENAREVIRELS